MGESAGKGRKPYVDCPTGDLKTCLTHVHRNYPDECKVLRDFGAKHAKGKPTKDHVNYPFRRKKINRQHEKNSIIINVVDEIL